MIITLDPEAPKSAVDAVIAQAERYGGVTTKLYEFVGAGATVREVHLIGSTRAVPTEPFEALAGVRAVNRVSAGTARTPRPTPSSTTASPSAGTRCS
jgi:3-deoxy-7-phosphoheptulonate synthase